MQITSYIAGAFIARVFFPRFYKGGFLGAPIVIKSSYMRAYKPHIDCINSSSMSEIITTTKSPDEVYGIATSLIIFC